jgi:hypothetical protein
MHTLIVSPDGRNLYAGSVSPIESVTTFARDARTGTLRQLPGMAGCMSFGAALPSLTCPRRGPRTSGILELDQSADGAFVTYANPDGLNPPMVFRRAAGDGSLEPVAPLCQPECEPDSVVGSLWLSPDGRTAYVADPEGQVTLWTRRPDTGQLTTQEIVYRVPCAGRNGCEAGRAAMYVSASGRTAYLSFTEFGVIALTRDPRTGRLTRIPGRSGCVAIPPRRRPHCASAEGLLAPGELVVPADERNVYAVTEDPELFSVTALGRRTG